ncbi:MAG: hypothetical protein KGQ59_04600 [Bdellovibrionales bacterium]|nr:hypothetical protein [Bdellovibrionales bacterium]
MQTPVEGSFEAGPNVRGHATFQKNPTRWKRLLALLADSPIHLLGPVFTTVVLAQPLIPSLKTLLLWMAWSLVFSFGAVLAFGQTFGQRLWGIQRNEQGTLEVRSNAGKNIGNLLVTTFLIIVSALTTLFLIEYHPMLQRFKLDILEPYRPAETELNFSTLPMYYTLGAFPHLIEGQPVTYQLPYGKGPPDHFPPEILMSLPPSGNRLVISGPRTPKMFRGRRSKIRQCLLTEDFATRFSIRCLRLRHSIFPILTENMIPEGTPARDWSARWIEVGSRVEDSETRAVGVEISATTPDSTIHRMVLLTPEGSQQNFTLKIRTLTKTPQKDFEVFEKIVRSLEVSSRLEPQLEWLRAQTKDSASPLSSSAESIAKIIAKTTIQPGNPENYFQLSESSLSILKQSAKTPANTALASAQPQALAALKYLKDVAPSDPRIKTLEQKMLGIQGF